MEGLLSTVGNGGNSCRLWSSEAQKENDPSAALTIPRPAPHLWRSDWGEKELGISSEREDEHTHILMAGDIMNKSRWSPTTWASKAGPDQSMERQLRRREKKSVEEIFKKVLLSGLKACLSALSRSI